MYVPHPLVLHHSALELTAFRYQRIAQNALTILINLSHDDEVLGNLAEDDAFLETVLKKITVRIRISFIDLNLFFVDMEEQSGRTWSYSPQ
jgi:hypothetical protein